MDGPGIGNAALIVLAAFGVMVVLLARVFKAGALLEVGVARTMPDTVARITGIGLWMGLLTSIVVVPLVKPAWFLSNNLSVQCLSVFFLGVTAVVTAALLPNTSEGRSDWVARFLPGALLVLFCTGFVEGSTAWIGLPAAWSWLAYPLVVLWIMVVMRRCDTKGRQREALHPGGGLVVLLLLLFGPVPSALLVIALGVGGGLVGLACVRPFIDGMRVPRVASLIFGFVVSLLLLAVFAEQPNTSRLAALIVLFGSSLLGIRRRKKDEGEQDRTVPAAPFTRFALTAWLGVLALLIDQGGMVQTAALLLLVVGLVVSLVLVRRQVQKRPSMEGVKVKVVSDKDADRRMVRRQVEGYAPREPVPGRSSL